MATPAVDVLESIVKVYESGVVLANLAKQFEVSIPTMSKWIVKAGGKIRPRGQRPKNIHDVVGVNPCAEVDVEVTLDPQSVREGIAPAEALPTRQLFTTMELE